MRKKIKKMNTGGMSPGFNADPLYSFAQGQMSGGSGMGQLMPELQQQNEFDQAAGLLNKAEKAKKGYMTGKQLLETARGVKKGTDIAANSKNVTDVLGSLGQGTSTAATTAATEVAKQGIQHGSFAKFLKTGAGGAAAAGLGIGGKIIQEIDKKDGNYSKAGAMGGGAMQGAAMGAALGPMGMIAGGAIGAGVGLMQKNKFEAEARAQELTQKTEASKADARTKLAGSALLKTFPVEGIKEQVYAHGGTHGGKTLPLVSYGPQINPAQAQAAHQNRPDVLRQAPSDAQFERTSNAYIDKRSLKQANQAADKVVKYHMNNPLDAIGLDLAAIGQVPFVGEPADLLNSALSAGRSAYYGYKGDTAKAGKHAGLSALSATSALPFVGNATGAVRLAHGTHKLAHGAHKVERGVIAAKAADAASKGYASGGYTSNPDYIAEGGEMIQHAPGDLPATDKNGTVKPVTDTIARIKGDKHIAQSGGVGMSGDKPARIYSDQLHVPADVLKQLMKL